MKTRNRQQQEIEWLKEKVKLLERIIELEREIVTLKTQPIYIPYQPYNPYIPPYDPYNPTIIWGTGTQTIRVDDSCTTVMSS